MKIGVTGSTHRLVDVMVANAAVANVWAGAFAGSRAVNEQERNASSLGKFDTQLDGFSIFASSP